MTIKTEIYKYLNKIGAQTLPCKTSIVNGREVPAAPLVFLGGFRRIADTDIFAETDGGRSGITKRMLEIHASDFDSPFRGDYRSVITDPNWLAFYHATPNPVAWICVDQGGAPAPFIYQRGIPCWSCGILLPMQAIQVDHSRPQAGEPMEAVAKLFRHKNLTEGRSKGAKGRANFGGPVGAHTLAQRYTLNTMGRMMFQIIISAGQRAELLQSCLNNYANLRPMCAQCNTARNAGPVNKF